jgi:hypothetical protein
MHKGTPFYYVSWLAFTVQDYEKAVFYMDAAISEDIKVAAQTDTPDSWKVSPAASFLLLDEGKVGPPGQAITRTLVQKLNDNVSRLNTNTRAELDLNLFRNKFVIANINSAKFRSIISGLYVFMLEYNKRYAEIKLRSSEGGSIKPFLTHLFSGGVIFESLLKISYGGSETTLGAYLQQSSARSTLEISTTEPAYHRDRPQQGGYTLPDIIKLLPTWQKKSYTEKIIAVAYSVRNTTAHDLSWIDVFDPEVYSEIYGSICDAILWHIWKVHVQKT